MKDAFGQHRAAVQTREMILGAVFVAVTGIGIWAVALPALDESHPEEPREAASTGPDATGPAAPVTSP